MFAPTDDEDTNLKMLAPSIAHLCARPKMFTASGSYGEIEAYIEGFSHGAHRHGTRNPMDTFASWINDRHNLGLEIVDWRFAMKALYPEEESRLEGFHKSFKAFCEEKDMEFRFPRGL